MIPADSLFVSSGASTPKSTVTPASTDEVDELVHAYTQTTWGDRPPLPTESYPRTFPKRTATRGRYAALGLWYLASSVLPLSAIYLTWFIVSYQGQRNYRVALFAAAYAMCEIAFGVYMGYTVRRVQRPSPPSNLSPDRRQELLRKIMTADLAADPRADMSGHKLQERMWEMFGSDTKRAGEDAHGGEKERGGMTTRSRRSGRTSARVEKDLTSEKLLKRDIEVQVNEGLRDPVGHMQQLHHAHPRAVEFRERLRTWFHHAPWESIKRDNVLEWLAWSCFNMEYDRCKADDDRVAFLANSIEMLEARTGTVFEQGYNRKIKIMRLTLDPVNAKGRPLIMYAFTNAVNWYLRVFVLASHGMAYHKEGEIGYLVRIPPGWTPAKARSDTRCMPIVYMHGLGFGLLQSHLLIKSLVTKLDTHPILVPLAPYTSQAVFNRRHLRPWTQNEVVEGMTAICKRWGFWDGKKEGGVSMMSHSNGSVAHAWLLKRCPDMIKRNTFVDPVCFCLWEGDICYSFCYRKPKTALETLLFYFIASEHFDWADNNLFVDEIPALRDSSRTAFFFGGHDIIIDAARARRYLERHGVAEGLHWDEEGGHGDGLAGESLSTVMTYVATGSVRC